MLKINAFKLLTILACFTAAVSFGQSRHAIIPGADQTQLYLDYLKGKNIGMVVNQTSVIGARLTPSVDSLLKLGINIKKIFGPEHGFRGDASNGATVNDSNDPKTGLPVISLYGKHYKPTPTDLQGINLMIFDVQDVGARFYTYISTLHYVMEACAENNIELMILDRPNPNGFCVDGPVLDTAFRRDAPYTNCPRHDHCRVRPNDKRRRLAKKPRAMQIKNNKGCKL